MVTSPPTVFQIKGYPYSGANYPLLKTARKSFSALYQDSMYSWRKTSECDADWERAQHE